MRNKNDEKINALNSTFKELVDALIEGGVLFNSSAYRYDYFHVSHENRRLKSKVDRLEIQLSTLIDYLNLEFENIESHLELKNKEREK